MNRGHSSMLLPYAFGLSVCHSEESRRRKLNVPNSTFFSHVESDIISPEVERTIGQLRSLVFN